MQSKTTDLKEQYMGSEADARAAAIDALLGTDDECPIDTIWLLRYLTVKHDIQWPTARELFSRGNDCAI